MATVSDERERLAARRSALREEITHVEYALAVLDRIDDVAPTRRRSVRQGRHVAEGGTTAVAAKVINESDRNWRVDSDLISALRAGGWDAQVSDEVNTVRAALTRAARDGLVSRPGLGVYGPLPHNQKPGAEPPQRERATGSATPSTQGAHVPQAHEQSPVVEQPPQLSEQSRANG